MTVDVPALDTVAATEAPTETAPRTVTLPAGFVPLGERSEEERQAILQRAHRGDTEATQTLFWSMALDPARGLRFTDLPRQTWRKLIDASTYRFANVGDSSTRALMFQHAEMVRASLLAETQGTALEHLLVDRIVTCHLAASLADADVSFYAGSSDGTFYLRRQDNMHKQLVRAIEALAKVQRLMRPGPLMALAQMNIAAPGSQQVNMVTPLSAPHPQHADTSYTA